MKMLLERLRRANEEIRSRDRELGAEAERLKKNVVREERAFDGGFEALTPFGSENVLDLGYETIVQRELRPVLAIREDAVRLEFTNDADSALWRNRLQEAAGVLGKAIRSVGRIEVTGHPNSWLGTGWLVDEDLVVTNRHVAREFAMRGGDGFVFRQSWSGPMTSRIDFLREHGNTRQRDFALSEVLYLSDDRGPDVAFLRVDRNSRYQLAEPIALASRAPRLGDRVASIGYPARDPRIPEQQLMLQIFGDVYEKKRLAPGEITRSDSSVVFHDCSTLGGNSGSPLIRLDTGEAVALHFAGRFLEANHAVPAATVLELLERVRRGSGRRPPNDVDRDGLQIRGGAGRELDLVIPIRVRIEVGDPRPYGGNAVSARDSGTTPQSGTLPGSQTTGRSRGPTDDAVVSEEGRPEDYADRKGYEPAFLGHGTVVPLPTVNADNDVLTFDQDGKKQRELRYQHFSVLMSKSRRQCFFSAVNIHGKLSRKTKRPSWRLDPRIGKQQQIIAECYGPEPKFSRGHMTRREDPAWGDENTANRGNSDSMHVTNTVPQMQPFNAGIWLDLEDYALQNAREDDMKITVFTGPVFKDDDPEMYGVRIPIYFWKVIAFIHDETKKLCATGYRMSQESYLREFVYGQFTYGDNETAQVSLADIEREAGVSFGDLRKFDPLDGQPSPEGRPPNLNGPGQIRWR